MTPHDTLTPSELQQQGWYDDAGRWHEKPKAPNPAEQPASPPAPDVTEPATSRPEPSAARLTRAQWRAQAIPTEGFRGFLYRATGGAINLGPSKTQIDRLEAERRAQAEREANEVRRMQRRAECIARMDRGFKLVRITVGQTKGGIGKTTNTIAIGKAFAKNCRLQVTAVDANPDRGNLADRVGKEATTTIRDLIDNIDDITGVNTLRGYLSQDKSRLEVLASDDNPVVRRALTQEEYHRVQDLLATYRQMILTDTGTDTTAAVLPAIMERTDVLVIAADVTAAGRKFTGEVLELWEQQAPGGADLVRRAVVSVRLPARPLDTRQLEEAIAPFRDRVAAVVAIPFDPHLDLEAGEDGIFDWDALHPETQDAYLELCAAVADQA